MDQKAMEAVKRTRPEGEWKLTKTFGENGVFPRTLILRYDGPDGTIRQILWKTAQGYIVKSQENYRNGKLVKYKVII